MDEWCSPYSSWLSTMKGCSGRSPSEPAVDTRARTSTGPMWSSRQGSASGPLPSGFFSAHCDWQSVECQLRKGLLHHKNTLDDYRWSPPQEVSSELESYAQFPWEKWGACSLKTATFSQTLVGERAGLALSNETWQRVMSESGFLLL